MSDYIVTNNVVTKDTLQVLYTSKLQASFSKFARSFTGSNTRVSISRTDRDAGQSPAWSGDNSITLVHYTTTGSIVAMDNLVRLKGLLIHELSHVLYTPRTRSGLATWVRSNDLWRAFNLLEDNRIENLMVANMSGVAPWLIHAVTKELLSEPQQQSVSLPLIWGRKYMPSNVRQLTFSSWQFNNAQKIADIIDEYIHLNLADTKVYPRAQELITQFNYELNQTSGVDNPNHNHSSESAPDSSTANTQTKKQQDDLLKQLDDIEEDSDSDSDTGGSAESSLSDALKSANASAAESVYEDVKSTIESVRDVESAAEVNQQSIDGAEREEIGKVNTYWVDKEVPLPEATIAAKRFARELTELRAQHDPGWLRKTESGRLNVREYMLGGEIDEIFDQWSDGNQDVTDIECVILLDNSGSMADLITPAYNAMWSIKRGLDSIGASTTVVQFGTYGEILYPAHQSAGPTILTARRGGGGGTAPFFSIKHAKKILDESSRAIKMLLVITDGQWYSAAKCDELVLAMRMSGVLTGLVFLAPDIADIESMYWLPKQDGKLIVDGHNCEVVQLVHNPLDIVDVAKSLTKLAQRKVLN